MPTKASFSTWPRGRSSATHYRDGPRAEKKWLRRSLVARAWPPAIHRLHPSHPSTLSTLTEKSKIDLLPSAVSRSSIEHRTSSSTPGKKTLAITRDLHFRGRRDERNAGASVNIGQKEPLGPRFFDVGHKCGVESVEKEHCWHSFIQKTRPAYISQTLRKLNRPEHHGTCGALVTFQKTS